MVLPVINDSALTDDEDNCRLLKHLKIIFTVG